MVSVPNVLLNFLKLLYKVNASLITLILAALKLVAIPFD
jgi:hypothetical protein